MTPWADRIIPASIIRRVMKVLHVLGQLRPSGAEANLRWTRKLWLERGFDIEILSSGDRAGVYAPVLAQAGYAVHHIPVKEFRTFVPAYLRLLRRGRYDLVHVHTERARLYLATLARLIARTPVVTNVHNVFAFGGNLQRERRIHRALLRRIGVVFVSVSRSVEEAELRYYGNVTRRIDNGYDDARFRSPNAAERRAARVQWGIGDSDFVVVSVGNCSDVKNHNALVEALGRLHEELPVRYLHVGVEQPGSPERALAEAVGLDGHASFLGYVEDVVRVLHAADCYVMPSRQEGMAVAALEALGCGVPSVLADVPGLRDLTPLFPGVQWVSPEPGPVEKAVREVTALDADAVVALREELSATARRHFSMQRVVRQYSDLYAGLAGV